MGMKERRLPRSVLVSILEHATANKVRDPVSHKVGGKNQHPRLLSAPHMHAVIHTHK